MLRRVKRITNVAFWIALQCLKRSEHDTNRLHQQHCLLTVSHVCHPSGISKNLPCLAEGSSTELPELINLPLSIWYGMWSGLFLLIAQLGKNGVKAGHNVLIEQKYTFLVSLPLLHVWLVSFVFGDLVTASLQIMVVKHVEMCYVCLRSIFPTCSKWHEFNAMQPISHITNCFNYLKGNWVHA